MSERDEGGYRYPPTELIAAIYDARHPGEWQWSNLTSGEQDIARRDIVGVLDATPDEWAKIDGNWTRIKARLFTLAEIATQAQYLLDLDGDRIPHHVQLWLRDLVADFTATSHPTEKQQNTADTSDTLGAE